MFLCFCINLLSAAIGFFFSSNKGIPDGYKNIGNILYDENHELGEGCEGTYVFK